MNSRGQDSVAFYAWECKSLWLRQGLGWRVLITGRWAMGTGECERVSPQVLLVGVGTQRHSILRALGEVKYKADRKTLVSQEHQTERPWSLRNIPWVWGHRGEALSSGIRNGRLSEPQRCSRNEVPVRRLWCMWSRHVAVILCSWSWIYILT